MILQITFYKRKLQPCADDLIEAVHECKDALSIYLVSIQIIPASCFAHSLR